MDPGGRRGRAAAPSGPLRCPPAPAPAVAALGFAGAAEYLHERHVVQRRSVNAIAAEVGMSHHAVEAALARHGLPVTAHAARRHAAEARADGVAAALGYDSIGSYLSDRRAAGRSWRAIAAESAQPASWLRRQQSAAGDRSAE